ncbi:hypothetical protein CRG98_022014 [Punica granatum]|uniref:Aminotransferase-like plant mobile domain-containing protein n=1 Tax=Punica granatum TaxID=22663 RepID=A0A2I0JNN7_PUNGR|nr:hypothetical protein CRG98_022014 [Punica granatum]
MSRPVSCPRLDRVTPPLEEIIRIWGALRPVDRRYISAFIGDIPLLTTQQVVWNFLEATIAFWNPSRAVFDIQGTELTPTIEEYRTLIGRTTVVHGIAEPNFHTARPTLVSRLLGVPTTRLNAELAYSGSTEIAIEKLLFFIESRVLIDAALASVVLQVVGGRGYEVLDAWRTMITERPYFPEHPTLDERDFQATEEYIIRFYRWAPTAHEDLVNSPRVGDGGSPDATPTPNMAIQAELTYLRAERNRLRREVAERDEQLVDQRQLQRELT